MTETVSGKSWANHCRQLRTGFVILCMAVTLTACDGKNMDEAVGIGDANPAETPPAATPVPTLPPTPVPVKTTPPPPKALADNVKFDTLRARGMAQLYDGDTDGAMKSFEEALKIKPGDKTIKQWQDAISTRTDLYRLEAIKKKLDDLTKDNRFVIASPSPSSDGPVAMPSVLVPSLPVPPNNSYRVPATLPPVEVGP